MPLPHDLFKRLSALNRRRLDRHLATGAEVASGEDRAGPQDAAPDGPAALEDLVPGCEREARGGRYWLSERPADDFLSPSPHAAHADPDREPAHPLPQRYRHVVCGAGRTVAPDALHESLHPLLAGDPEGLVYLDIETCGLAGEPVFLVGLLAWAGGGLRLRQFLARDYAEEGPMLAATWQALAEADCLVTYNGRTFDVPTLGARSLACGLFDLPPCPAHVDLLPEARRRWKGVLPNCRLTTVETAVCGRRRLGDVPGADIPAAYHAFVRSQQSGTPRRRQRDLRRLQAILHHNALDLLTLADLVTRVFAGEV
ncbi:MAG: ribonuclease H-like domain-containing protein [Phycisphaerae bacterium]